MFSTLDQIKNAKTTELVDFYNKLSGKPAIKKFRDRATAERRCTEVLQKVRADALRNQPIKIIEDKTVWPLADLVMQEPKTPPAQAKRKMFVVMFRDHSGSMTRMAEAARKDFNNTLSALKKGAEESGVETVLCTYSVGGGFKRGDFCSIKRAKELTSYPTPGYDTPLFAAINDAIKVCRTLPDDPNTVFLFCATTDGADNASSWNDQQALKKSIAELQNSDRWSFAFRVPKGYKRNLVSFGISEDNILEWELNSKGLETASAVQTASVDSFFRDVSAGKTSTRTFYASAANVTEEDVKKLGDIGGEVTFWPVNAQADGAMIRDFVENRSGKAMLKGAAFYQLTKTEDKIQDYKLIAIRNKDTGAVYCGREARTLIGLPLSGDARVRPDTSGKWQVFVQSTSVNRKLVGGTQVMYWPGVGVRFKEGKSATV